MRKSDKTEREKQLKELSGYLAVVVLFLMFNFFIMIKLNYPVQIQLTIETEMPSKFQMYWRSAGKGYEERKSVQIKIYPGQTEYTLSIASYASFDWLRIDPVNSENPVTIKGLKLRHNLYKPLVIFPREQALDLRNSYDLGSIHQSREVGLSLKPSGKDPHFEFTVAASLKKSILYSFIFLVFLATILLFLLLNQRLLKGSKKAASVQMTIPIHESRDSKTNILTVARKYCSGSQLVSLKSKQESDKVIVYFPTMTTGMLIDFVNEVKKKYQTAQCRIQYNRSGEV